MDSIKAAFQDAIFEDRYMWVFDNRIQAICKINIDNFEMEIVSVYQNKERFIAYRMFLHKDKFYIVTRDSLKILIYNREAQEKNSEFFLWEMQIDIVSDVYAAFLYNACIWFFPHHMNEDIVCFDISTETYSKKILFDVSLKQEIGNQNVIVRYPSFYKGIVWFVLYGTNFYAKYDLAKEKIDLFRAEDANMRLDRICFDGEQIWLMEIDNSHITSVGKRTVEIAGEYSYSHPYYIGEWIVLPPKGNDRLVLINRKLFSTTVIDLSLGGEEKPCEGVVNCCEYGDYIFLFQSGLRDLLMLHKITLELKCIALRCEKYIKRCFSINEMVLKEDTDINLEKILNFLEENNELFQKRESNMKMGEDIWKVIDNYV